MKRPGLVVLITLALTLSAFPIAIGSAEQITITVAATYKSEMDAYMADFYSRYPNIKVEFAGAGFTNPEKIFTLEAAGTPMDIYYVRGTEIHMYIAKGILEPIDAYIQKYNYSINDFVAQSLVSVQGQDGKLYGLPYDIGVNVQYYNRDHLAEAGVAASFLNNWTFNDMKDLAHKLMRVNADGQVTRVGYTPVNWNSWSFEGNYLAPWGARMFSDDESSLLLSEPAALTALSWWQQTLQDPAIVVGKSFPKNQTSLAVAGIWEIGSYNAVTGLDFDLGLLPVGPAGRYSSFQSSGYGISRQSKQKEAAWIFLSDWMGPRGMELYWAKTKMPARWSAIKHFAELFLKDKNMSSLEQTLSIMLLGRPVFPPGEAFYTQSKKLFSQFWSNELSPVQLADSAASLFSSMK
ncbi:MAG TPA: extracellular solute-binding protein [Firmicutes bacterium]|nr:extracellular solute-binding protein [Bacillota bacterium]